MRNRALAVASLVLLVVWLSLPAEAEAVSPMAPFLGRPIADVSWMLGTAPEGCFHAPDGVEDADACVWRIYERLASWPELSERLELRGDAIHLVCTADGGAEESVVSGCDAHDATQVEGLYPQQSKAPRKTGTALRKSKTGSLQRAAKKRMEKAISISAMIRLVGDVPDSCANSAGAAICQWSLYSITPGYLTVARYYDAQSPGGNLRLVKKLRMVCRFPSAGGPVADEPCKISLLD